MANESVIEIAEGIIKQSVAYIEVTQPKLDKAAMFDEVFSKKASELAETLKGNGLIDKEGAEKLVGTLVDDKIKLFDLVEKFAALAGKPEEFGKSASEDFATVGSKVDPFDALVMYGDVRASSNASNTID